MEALALYRRFLGKWNQVKRIPPDSLNQWNMHEIRQYPERIDFTHKEMRLDNSILLFRNFFSLLFSRSLSFSSFLSLSSHSLLPAVLLSIPHGGGSSCNERVEEVGGELTESCAVPTNQVYISFPHTIL